MLDHGVEELEGEDGYVQFSEAEASAAGEYRCADCGYGVTVQSRLPTCPMCGGRAWERSPWSPFERAAAWRL